MSGDGDDDDPEGSVIPKHYDMSSRKTVVEEKICVGHDYWLVVDSGTHDKIHTPCLGIG